MKIALVVGHTPVAPGVKNQTSGVNEFAFNRRLADMIVPQACEVEMVWRGLPDDYQGLPARINAVRPDFIIEMHCNGFSDPAATGTEVLYWHTSTKGKGLALILQMELVAALGLRSRGVKAIKAGERGAHILQKTNAPCVIAEPFFLTNDSDFRRANEEIGALARAYVRAIKEMAKPG